MPCVADTVCTRGNFNPLQYIQPNQFPSPSEHYANMGWVGFAKLFIEGLSGGEDTILRVTGADINLSQEITMPDVIDGRIDRTVYQLGPKIVEGTLSMPLIHDIANPSAASGGAGCPNPADLQIAGALLQNIWCWATARDSHGRLLFGNAQLDIRYANHAAFVFDRAIVNTFSLSVAQQDVVSLDLNVIGRGRTPAGDFYGTSVDVDPKLATYLAPARIMTWNDITVNGIGGCGQWAGRDLFFSNQVREFNLEINNNADRFYSMNGSLFPVDINVGKREITGSLTLMGLQEQLRQLAESNSERFTEKNEIRFAVYVGEDRFNGTSFDARDWRSADGTSVPADAIFGKRITGVVFEIETMSMTNELFETEINFHALASDQDCYEAIGPATSGTFPAWQ